VIVLLGVVERYLVHPAAGTSLEETLVGQTDGQAGPVAVAEGLLEVLGQVPDPRDPQGVRHSFVSLLAIAIGAAESGATSWVEIGEFASELTAAQLAWLGARPSPYTGRYTRRTRRRSGGRCSSSTLRRWNGCSAAGSLPGSRGRRPSRAAAGPAAGPAGEGPTAKDAAGEDRLVAGAVAVDGKTLRGAVGSDGQQVHLLAALDQQQGTVLAQRRVDGKSNQSGEFRPLLDKVDLAGRSSPPTRSTASAPTPATWLATARRTTCL
jgi:hypothetical protein